MTFCCKNSSFPHQMRQMIIVEIGDKSLYKKFKSSTFQYWKRMRNFTTSSSKPKSMWQTKSPWSIRSKTFAIHQLYCLFPDQISHTCQPQDVHCFHHPIPFSNLVSIHSTHRETVANSTQLILKISRCEWIIKDKSAL